MKTTTSTPYPLETAIERAQAAGLIPNVLSPFPPSSKPASPEQLALNVARWQEEQRRRKNLLDAAKAGGISVKELKSLRRSNEKTLGLERRSFKAHKASLHATLGTIAGWHKAEEGK